MRELEIPDRKLFRWTSVSVVKLSRETVALTSQVTLVGLTPAKCDSYFCAWAGPGEGMAPAMWTMQGLWQKTDTLSGYASYLLTLASAKRDLDFGILGQPNGKWLGRHYSIVQDMELCCSSQWNPFKLSFDKTRIQIPWCDLFWSSE